jgi:hypothetical protein
LIAAICSGLGAIRARQRYYDLIAGDRTYWEGSTIVVEIALGIVLGAILLG